MLTSMSIKKRLTPEESRHAALEAARELLIEQGPQAVTLKAVAAKIGRTHANLLHHFGSAGDLQKELARHLGRSICATMADQTTPCAGSSGVLGSPLMPMTVRTASSRGARWRPNRITVGVPCPGM